MIEGVIIKDLKIFPDEKGDVRHMMRVTDPWFEKFGEVYFSFINSGYIKAWKKHTKQTQHFAVPIGQIKVVLYDDRADSSTKGNVEEYVLGENCYKLLIIPPGVWYGFQAQHQKRAMVVNCVDLPHDPVEAVRKDVLDQSIPYQWENSI